MTFDLKLDETRLAEVQKLLANIPDGAKIAIMRALNRGVEKIRTEAVRYICARYTIKAITVRQHLRVVKATRESLQASVIFSSASMKLANFQYKPKVMKQKGISVAKRKHLVTEIKKGQPTEWAHAFLATMKSGHTGIFIRGEEGSQKSLRGRSPLQQIALRNRYHMSRAPLKEFHSLYVPQMASYETIMRAYLDAAQQRMRETLNQQILFMLQTGRTGGRG